MREQDNDEDLEYVRSRWSGNTDCVIVARRADGNVAVRNSRELDTPPLVFTGAEWTAFLKGVRTGDFDAV